MQVAICDFEFHVGRNDCYTVSFHENESKESLSMESNCNIEKLLVSKMQFCENGIKIRKYEQDCEFLSFYCRRREIPRVTFVSNSFSKSDWLENLNFEFKMLIFHFLAVGCLQYLSNRDDLQRRFVY